MVEVILFTQETCGACATQREKNDGIEDKYPAVQFREVDIRADIKTAEEYGVRKTPTTLVYANGDQTAEFIGTVDREDLESAIDSAAHTVGYNFVKIFGTPECRNPSWAYSRQYQQSAGLAQRLVDIVHG